MQTFGDNTDLANILQIVPYCYYPTLHIPKEQHHPFVSPTSLVPEPHPTNRGHLGTPFKAAVDSSEETSVLILM